MGLIIAGVLLPYEITPKQWEQVYEEALRLVNAYDFVDVIDNEEKYARYNLIWRYAEKSTEREIKGHLGVGIYGSYSGCIHAEKFILYRDYDRYLPRKWFSDEIIQPEPNALLCHDVLIGRHFPSNEVDKYQDCQKMVFGGKTQGYPHHVYLLAIGLLLEDRLGKAFTVYGDITRGQIKAAIEWANTVLDNPISLPCVMDNVALFERLQAFVPRESLLASFLYLTFSACDEAMYQFLQSRFSEEELVNYWKKEISGCVPGTIGASNFLSQYFNMTDDLMLLTKVCACKYSPKEFAAELASLRVFEQSKNTDNPVATLSHDSDIEEPETIETTMGKILALVGGGFPHNSAVERFIPLEQGIRDITLAYRDLGEVDLNFEALLRNAIEDAAPKNKDISENLDIFEEFSNQMEKQTAQIDIIDPEDLVFYELGDTIAPAIKLNLKGIREFIVTRKVENAQYYMQNFPDKESTNRRLVRMAIIVSYCAKLLPKSIWDMFEQNIEDDNFFFTLLSLNRLKSYSNPLSYYVKGLLYNPVLFKQVLLVDDVSWLN